MRTSICSLLMISFLMILSCADDEPTNSDQAIIIEGKEYKVIKIGTQSWMASNYAGPGGLNYDAAASRPEYGKYYTKIELNSFTLPPGWRVPTQEDYITMVQHYGLTVPSHLSNSENIKTLISTTHWKNVKGTNLSGFNAYPAGYIFKESIPMDGDIAEFWTSEGFSLSIQEAGVNQSSLRISFYDNNTSPDYRFNVRFVKDN